MSLPRALALALAQLGDPAILKALGKTAASTLAIFLLGGVALYVGFETAIDSATSMDTGGLGALAAAAGTLVAGWFLFRVVALFVLQFHADEVVRAVEARHYPQSANAARQLGFGEEMGHALRSLGRTLLANVLALPVAGLMSLAPFEEVRDRLVELRAAARSLGVTLEEPFLQLAFLALPVIPALKITDRGMVDVLKFEIIPG